MWVKRVKWNHHELYLSYILGPRGGGSMFHKSLRVREWYLSTFEENVGLIERIRKCSLIPIFLKFEKNWCWLIFKYLVEFISKAVRSRIFLCWEIFEYRFNLLIKSIQIFRHDLVLVGFISLGICPFNLGYLLFFFLVYSCP